MPAKDDPLEGAPWYDAPSGRTLLLEPDGNAQARANYALAFFTNHPEYGQRMGNEHVRDMWDIAWAAAIAAHSFVWEGRVKPK